MFNIFSQDKEKEEDRSHQDNFYSKSAFNNNWQYCRICDKNRRFEYDRCEVCKSN